MATHLDAASAMAKAIAVFFVMIRKGNATFFENPPSKANVELWSGSVSAI
jgi:hypothetical protein